MGRSQINKSETEARTDEGKLEVNSEQSMLTTANEVENPNHMKKGELKAKLDIYLAAEIGANTNP